MSTTDLNLNAAASLRCTIKPQLQPQNTHQHGNAALKPHTTGTHSTAACAGLSCTHMHVPELLSPECILTSYDNRTQNTPQGSDLSPRSASSRKRCETCPPPCARGLPGKSYPQCHRRFGWTAGQPVPDRLHLPMAFEDVTSMQACKCAWVSTRAVALHAVSVPCPPPRPSPRAPSPGIDLLHIHPALCRPLPPPSPSPSRLGRTDLIYRFAFRRKKYGPLRPQARTEIYTHAQT